MTKLPMQVDLVNVGEEGHQINQMEESTKVMNVLCVSFPLKLVEILHNFGVENAELICSSQTIKQIVNILKRAILIIRHRREHVQSILDLIELLAGFFLFVLL
jgi:hypothetical protein